MDDHGLEWRDLLLCMIAPLALFLVAVLLVDHFSSRADRLNFLGNDPDNIIWNPFVIFVYVASLKRLLQGQTLSWRWRLRH